MEFMMQSGLPSNHQISLGASPGAVTLADIFDIEELQKIQDSFSLATGLASIITYPDGTPFTAPSNFSRLCSEVIRCTEKGRANCIKSDAVLGRYNPEGPVFQPCLSGGLWDAAARITVGDHHIGNWLIGQVRNEVLDEAQMLAYADEIGADRQVFRSALSEIPVMSMDQFRNIANTLFLLANQLSDNAYKNLQLTKTIKQREQAENELKASEARYRRIVETASEGIVSLDSDGFITYANSIVLRMWGYPPEELLGRHVTEFMYPEDHADHWEKMSLRSHGNPGHYERRHKKKDGSEVWCLVSSSPVMAPDGSFDGSFGMLTDITDRKRAELALEASERRFSELIRYSSDSITILDKDGVQIFVSDAAEGMLGYKPSELTGIPVIEEMLHPDDRERVMAVFSTILSEGRGGTQYRHKHKNGSWVHLEAWGTNQLENPDIRGVVVNVRDITERKQAEESLRLRESYLTAIIENQPGLVWLKDSEGRFLTVNSKFAISCGKTSPEALVGETDIDIWPLELATKYIRDDKSVVQGGHPARAEEPIFDNGETRWFETFKMPVRDEQGNIIGTTGYAHDITERKQMEEQLLFRALHDPLTGLANRTLCLDRIAQANERAARDKSKAFAVVFIDLDRFKVVNDSLGHEAGDSLLRGVAQRLVECARKVDTVSRYGGDEFALVLEEISERETVRTIKRIRQSLKAPMLIGAHEVQVEASYGIVYGPRIDSRSEDLLRNANIALHHAKHSGRNRLVAYRSGMHEAATHAMQFQSDMRRGLEAREFFMMYQPIFNLNTNSLAGFEALIRWRHPTRGIVGPVDFIPLAEETGFIFELGAFALSQSCSDMVDLLRDIAPEEQLTISVNLSPKQFARQGLVDQIEQAIISSGIQPSSLVLEITESSIMNYPEASVHTMARLKQKGVALAIDDFGTGYSSMSALQTMPLDRLKVDMSFVKRMSSSREDREIVRAIITLSHSLGLKTVAEGIETEEQRLALRHMGCDLGQGYLCSRPMFLADVPEAIRLNVCMSAV